MQKLAIEYLRTTVARLPDKTALVDDSGEITFGALWHRALHAARDIADRVGRNGLPVAVEIEKSIDAIVAIVAIQLSGNLYVPFDPNSPPERRERMLQTLGSPATIRVNIGALELDGQIIGGRATGADTSNAEIEAALFDGLVARKNIDPLYVIFTSGTTGTPKGVTISNAAVIDYIDWVRHTYAVDESEIIANQAPLYFDNSVLDIYLCFACGATLHLLAASRFMFPDDVVSYLAANKISLIFFVPSLLSNFAAVNALQEHDLGALRKVLFAGEPMPLSTLRYLRERLPQALLSNLYGPTEITVDAIYWTFGTEIETLTEVPLGKACENKTIIFLDEHGAPVTEPDAVAEICVAGVGVALGYWNNPERTAEVFIQNPEHSRYAERIYRTGDLGYVSSRDGLIYMTGRKDGQFKHRGYRIEPGEIESALSALGEVTQSCVIYDADHREIVAFYTPAEPGKELRGAHKLLAGRLPAYMIPRRFVAVARMPVTPNGKVDRKALWAGYKKPGG
ncbi:MAG: amino acid adenylation domain-containing protein [Chromatiales bacterium]|nr:amino acid adenylation domain-containing protein [Chromatiales bacterium]